MTVTVLDARALGRATVARQYLLRRVEVAVAHLAGMRAQAPDALYVGLWSRLAGFRTDDFAATLEITPFGAFGGEQDAVVAEGLRLLDFVTGAEGGEVAVLR